MKRLALVIFILSVIALTICIVAPIWVGMHDWGDLPPVILSLAVTAIISWIFASGLRPKDDPTGKKFVWPRIDWGSLGAWFLFVGLAFYVGAEVQKDQVGLKVGAILLFVGIVGLVISRLTRKVGVGCGWTYREGLHNAPFGGA